MRRSIIAVIGSFVTLTAPALAEPVLAPPESLITHIAYDRADLSSEAGVAQLHERIVGAASAMCAELNPSARDQAWCERRAITTAITQAQLPSLSLYHRMQASADEQTVSLSQR